jgi:hypothetical protein
MPVYEYWDRERGVKVELVKPVAERDRVPAHLLRITVPARLCVLGTTSNPRDPHGAEGQVPNALKSLSNGQVNEMVKESGFSVGKFKEVWDL